MCAETTEAGIDLLYTFYDETTDHAINLCVYGIDEQSRVPSIQGLYFASFSYENETHDLYGVRFVANMELDFGGHFFNLAATEPMTIITPEMKAERDKLAKKKAAAAAKAEKAAREAREAAEAAQAERAVSTSAAEADAAAVAAAGAAAGTGAASASGAAAASAPAAPKSAPSPEERAAKMEAKLAAMDPEKAAKIAPRLPPRPQRPAPLQERTVSSRGDLPHCFAFRPAAPRIARAGPS